MSEPTATIETFTFDEIMSRPGVWKFSGLNAVFSDYPDIVTDGNGGKWTLQFLNVTTDPVDTFTSTVRDTSASRLCDSSITYERANHRIKCHDPSLGLNTETEYTFERAC